MGTIMMYLYVKDMFQERDGIDDGAPNPRGASLSRLSIVLCCMAGTFVILRVLTRYFHGKLFGADDWLIVAAQVRASLSRHIN